MKIKKLLLFRQENYYNNNDDYENLNVMYYKKIVCIII